MCTVFYLKYRLTSMNIISIMVESKSSKWFLIFAWNRFKIKSVMYNNLF